MALPFPYGVQQITEQPVNSYPPQLSDLTNQNNQIQSARVINPVTQDYELNADGTFVGQSVVQTSVYLALFTKLNSSSVLGLGNNLLLVKIITPNVNTQVSSLVQQALSSLISQNLVSLVSCSTDNLGNGAISVNVNWIDLTANSANQNSFTTNVLIPL